MKTKEYFYMNWELVENEIVWWIWCYEITSADLYAIE